MNTDTLADSLSRADLVDVSYLELSAKVHADDTIEDSDDGASNGFERDKLEDEQLDDDTKSNEPSEKQYWRMAFTGGDGYVDVSLRLESRTESATLEVAALAHYHVDCDVDDFEEPLVEKASLEFAKSDAYVVLVPYIREAASDLARRIRARPPNIRRGGAPRMRNIYTKQVSKSPRG